MKHLNSVPGFKYVMPIYEAGPWTDTTVAGDYFQLTDCVQKEDGLYEGVIIHPLCHTHIHGLNKGERVSFSPRKLEPHVLIQEGFMIGEVLRHYPVIMDEHVLACTDCQKKVINSRLVHLLPKFLAKVAVPQPEGWDENPQKRIALLKQMQSGQYLPCGCQVTDTPWSKEQAANVFYHELAEIMEVSEAEAKRLPDSFKLLDLPLSTKSLRRLRNKFWIPDGSWTSEEMQDKEEGDKVRQLPVTIGEFVSEILRMHLFLQYTECNEHSW